MSNYSNTKAVVAANVYTNHNNEVTAAMVKAAINEVIDTLIAGGYLYKGVATTSTNPGSPDANVFYLTTAPGTYTNFGSLVVNDGEVCVLKYNGSWSKEVTGAATAAQVSQLREEVDELDLNIFGEEITTDTSNIEVSSGWSPSVVPPLTNVLSLYPGTYKITFNKGTIALDSSITGYSIQVVKKGISDANLSAIDSFSTPANKEYELTFSELTYVWVRAKGYASGVATLSAKYQGALDDVVVKTISQTLTDTEKKIARDNINAKSVSVTDGGLVIEGEYKSPLVFPVSLYADNSTSKYYTLYGVIRKDAKYIIDIISDTASTGLSLFTATDEVSSARVDTISVSTDINIGHNYYAFTSSQNILGGFININDSGTLMSANVYIKIYRVDKFSAQDSVDYVYRFDIDNYERLRARVRREQATDIAPCIQFKKKIADKFYMRLRVKFPTDVHDAHTPTEERTIFSINNGTDVFYAKLHKDKPVMFAGSSASNNSEIPNPNYTACVYAPINNDTTLGGGNCLQPDGWNKIFLLGEDAMSIRFKGDCSINANRDIRVKIDDTAITIYHYNTDVVIASYAKADYVSPEFSTENTYNVGDTVMYNGDRWECLADVETPGAWSGANNWFRKSEIASIYEKMVEDTDNNGPLSEFEVQWFNVARLSYDDLIRCEVKLVGLYKRYNPGDSPMNPTATAYDSFPFYFATKEKDRIYDIELALEKDAIWAKSQLIIDGYGIEFGHYYSSNLFNKECIITIGDNSSAHTLRNPEILDFEIREELDFKYPLARVYYAEYVEPGIAEDASTYYTAESRVCELADYLEQHQYNTVSLSNLIDYLNGGLALPKGKVYHFTHDDTGISFFTRDEFDRIVQTYLRHHIIPSFASITGDNYDNVADKIKALQNIGFYFYIHTYPDSDLATKSSGFISYDELTQGIESAMEAYMGVFGFYPIVWSFHQSGQNYNCIKALISRGFQTIFGSTKNGSINKINRYRVQRAAFRNNSNLSAQIYKHIDNYLVEDI